jgi:hypothetical protein
MWTLQTGREEVAKVQNLSRQFGYHVALGGSVLNRGESFKDLDLYFLPLDIEGLQPDSAGLLTALYDVWGEGVSMLGEHYNSVHYAHKVKYSTPKRIDVFVGR